MKPAAAAAAAAAAPAASAAAAAAAAVAAAATASAAAAASGTAAQLRAAHDVLVAQLAHLTAGGSLLSLPLSLLRPRRSSRPAAAVEDSGQAQAQTSAEAAETSAEAAETSAEAAKTQSEDPPYSEPAAPPSKATPAQASFPRPSPAEDDPRQRALDTLEAARRDLARRAVVLERAEEILADRKVSFVQAPCVAILVGT